MDKVAKKSFEEGRYNSKAIAAPELMRPVQYTINLVLDQRSHYLSAKSAGICVGEAFRSQRVDQTMAIHRIRLASN
jgi:hypothetical protein